MGRGVRGVLERVRAGPARQSLQKRKRRNAPSRRKAYFLPSDRRGCRALTRGAQVAPRASARVQNGFWTRRPSNSWFLARFVSVNLSLSRPIRAPRFAFVLQTARHTNRSQRNVIQRPPGRTASARSAPRAPVAARVLAARHTHARHVTTVTTKTKQWPSPRFPSAPPSRPPSRAPRATPSAPPAPRRWSPRRAWSASRSPRRWLPSPSPWVRPPHLPRNRPSRPRSRSAHSRPAPRVRPRAFARAPDCAGRDDRSAPRADSVLSPAPRSRPPVASRRERSRPPRDRTIADPAPRSLADPAPRRALPLPPLPLQRP